MNVSDLARKFYNGSSEFNVSIESINGTTDGNASYGILPFFHILFIFIGTIPCLYAFAHYKDLQTPFNLYVVSALLCDMGFFLQNIMKILESYTSYHWLQRKAYCQFFVFLSYLPSIITNNSHLLISLSRFWALYFPHHYRIHHTKKFALIACVACWISVFVVVAPILAVNEIYFVEPIAICAPLVEKQIEYYFFVQFYIDFPPLIIIFNYPILLYKYFRRSKIALNGEGKQTVVNGNSSVEKPSQREVHRKYQRRSGFLVLTWVFFCAIVFWAPVLVYAFMVALNPTLYSSAMFAFLYNWSIISNSLEPWMFMLTLRKLRIKIFRWKVCHH